MNNHKHLANSKVALLKAVLKVTSATKLVFAIK